MSQCNLKRPDKALRGGTTYADSRRMSGSERLYSVLSRAASTYRVLQRKRTLYISGSYKEFTVIKKIHKHLDRDYEKEREAEANNRMSCWSY